MNFYWRGRHGRQVQSSSFWRHEHLATIRGTITSVTSELGSNNRSRRMKTKRIFGWPQLLALCGLFACHNAFAFYNPSTGRWLSRDPIEERDGPSVYAFVRNLPVSLMDNLGLCGNCGPDVTGPLVHTLTSIRDYFDGMSYQSQRDSCYALIDPRP